MFVELHDYEPVAVRNKTEDEWAEEDINRCVLDGWPECNPKWGEKVDMQLVRGINYTQLYTKNDVFLIIQELFAWLRNLWLCNTDTERATCVSIHVYECALSQEYVRR